MRRFRFELALRTHIDEGVISITTSKKSKLDETVDKGSRDKANLEEKDLALIEARSKPSEMENLGAKA